jgi:hypothetical protein
MSTAYRRNAVDSSGLVVISTFPTIADAQIARGVLEAAGIESRIRSDNAGGMYPAMMGAELIVREEDAAKASDLLEPHES